MASFLQPTDFSGPNNGHFLLTPGLGHLRKMVHLDLAPNCSNFSIWLGVEVEFYVTMDKVPVCQNSDKNLV
jgi:hypothetical protein